MKKKIAVLLALIMIISAFPNNRIIKDVQAAENQKNGASIVNIARSYLGPMTYIYGGMDLSVGVDCSGFVCAVYKQAGIDLVSKNVRSSYDMWNNPGNINAVNIKSTSKADIRNGDLIITNNGGHVGIGTDKGTMVHQTNSTINAVQEVDLDQYSSAIVAIIRIDYTKWGGTNATNLDVKDAADKTEETDTTDTTANPGAPNTIPTTTVTYGSSGNDIKWLQTALNKVNAAGLEVDGAFGSITSGAVSDFQTKYGITASGAADKTTIDKLVEIFKLTNSITKIEIVEQDLKLKEGDKKTLTYKVTPETAASYPVTWSSSDEKIAKVNDKGEVEITGGGEVTITVKTVNGVTGTTKITSTAKPRSNEWHNGQWYSADGSTTYKYKGSWKHNNSGYWFEDESGWYPKNEWSEPIFTVLKRRFSPISSPLSEIISALTCRSGSRYSLTVTTRWR